MKTRIKLLVALALLTGILTASFQVVQAASAIHKPVLGGSAGGFCVVQGGIWVGSTIFNGECTYAPGSAGHTNYGLCTDRQYYVATTSGVVAFENQSEQGRRFKRGVQRPNIGGAPIFTFIEGCKDIPPPAGPGFGKCGNEVISTAEEVMVSTCNPSLVTITFYAGTCTGKCTVAPFVISGLKNKLSQADGDVIGEAYIKVRNPGEGSYKICMVGEGTIYQWVSGEWRALATSTSAGQSCAFSSGDGNYVLVK